MKLKTSIESKEDIEKFILIINIGIMTAISEGVFIIKEAENYIYSPYSIEIIKKIGVNENIVKLINLGCELEDVESLIPHKLQDAIDDIRNTAINLLRKFGKSKLSTKKWID
ncbi:MAG TPA: DUF3969 domain-containing protein [Clostridiales bacterium]|nr:MAG: hypothetical protein A2Y18_07830 [Clostridiales bacterium GWD2_32_19]HCC07101.1 DUF3969 domain-containing protein [Clostridiales bacterium]